MRDFDQNYISIHKSKEKLSETEPKLNQNIVKTYRGLGRSRAKGCHNDHMCYVLLKLQYILPIDQQLFSMIQWLIHLYHSLPIHG